MMEDTNVNGHRTGDLNVEEQQSLVESTKVLDNAIVISNIVELTGCVIRKLAGADIASSLNDESLSRDVINNLIINKLKETILR